MTTDMKLIWDHFMCQVSGTILWKA